MAAGAIGVQTSVRVVEATDSGEPEATTTAYIPQDTGVDMTVEAYSSDSDSDLVESQTVSLDDGENTYILDSLGEHSYYDFKFHLGTSASESPSVGSVLLELPADAYVFKDYTDGDWLAKPPDAQIVFDEAKLRKYQPKLVMSRDTRRMHKGMYGYVAKSSERDTDVYCYWNQLTHQDGLPFVGQDSHLGDHEPIFVYVNSSTGELDRIIYSAGHWYAGEVLAENAVLTQSRASTETHASFAVDESHHHHSYTTEDGAFVSLNSWPAVRGAWQDNEFYEPVQPEAVENPWSMLDRPHWWEDGSRDAKIVEIYRKVNIGDWDQTDQLKIEAQESNDSEGFFASLFSSDGDDSENETQS